MYQQSSRKETSRKIFQNQSKNFLKPDYFLPETNLRIFHNQISFETKPVEELPKTRLFPDRDQFTTRLLTENRYMPGYVRRSDEFCRCLMLVKRIFDSDGLNFCISDAEIECRLIAFEDASSGEQYINQICPF